MVYIILIVYNSKIAKNNIISWKIYVTFFGIKIKKIFTPRKKQLYGILPEVQEHFVGSVVQ